MSSIFFSSFFPLRNFHKSALLGYPYIKTLFHPSTPLDVWVSQLLQTVHPNVKENKDVYPCTLKYFVLLKNKILKSNFTLERSIILNRNEHWCPRIKVFPGAEEVLHPVSSYYWIIFNKIGGLGKYIRVSPTVQITSIRENAGRQGILWC